MTSHIRKILDVIEELDSPSALSKLYFFLRLIIIPSIEIDKILPKTGSIVDLGCGNGPLALYLALSSKDRKITGWDINQRRIQDGEKASKNLKNISFELKNPVENKLPNADVFIASDFLHHVPYKEQEIIIHNVFINMNPDGLFLIKEVDKGDIPRYFGSFIFDHALYPKDKIYFRKRKEWIKLLEKNGFNVSAKKAIFWFPASTTLLICKK